MPRQAFSPEKCAKAGKNSRIKYESQRIYLGKAKEEWECQREVCGGSHIDFALHLLTLHRAHCSDLHRHGVKGPQQDGESQARQPRTQHLNTPEQHYGDLQPLEQETTAEKTSLREDELVELTQSSNTQTTSIIKEVLQQKTNYNSLESGDVHEQLKTPEQTSLLEDELSELTQSSNTKTTSIIQEKTAPFKSMEYQCVQEQVTTEKLQGVTEGMTVVSLSVKEAEAKLSQSHMQEEAIEYQYVPQVTSNKTHSLPHVTPNEIPALIPEANCVQLHAMQKQTAIAESENEVMFLPLEQQTTSRDAAMGRRVIQDYEQNNVQIKYYWCMPCQWLLQENELKDHILSHVEGQLVHCARCVEGFTSERLVLKHLLNHRGVNIRSLLTKGFTIRHLELAGNVRDKVEQRMKPPLCQIPVATKTAITMHKDDVDQRSVLPAHDLTSRLALNVDLQGILKETGQPVKCKLCGEGFKYRHNMRKHLPVHDEETPYRCGMCDKYFTTQDELNQHETELCDTLEYTCATCGKIFKKKERLKEHELRHSKVQKYKGPYICETCGKVYQAESGLTTHMYKHTGKWPHKCAICDKGYAAIGELTNHMASHSNLRPYNCQICGKSFMRKCDVHSHQQVHKTDRPFMCSICGKGFKTKFVFQKHEQSHSEQRNHQCTVCGQTFKVKDNMKKHMSVHSAERKHQCGECGKRFPRRSAVTKHMLTHTQVRAHKCKVCGDSFRQSGHLVTHMMRHTGEWSHKCSRCGKGFGNPGHLSKHMGTKHGST